MGLGGNGNFTNLASLGSMGMNSNLTNSPMSDFVTGNLNSQKVLGSKNIPKFGLFSNKIIQR